MSFGEAIGVWVAAGLTLMMFSFIYRDNVLFKIGEHLYLGLSVGYFINVQYWSTIYPEVISRIAGDDIPFEAEPLESLARDGQLMARHHDGFWAAMDTLRDKNQLEALWASGQAPWRLWS